MQARGTALVNCHVFDGRRDSNLIRDAVILVDHLTSGKIGGDHLTGGKIGGDHLTGGKIGGDHLTGGKIGGGHLTGGKIGGNDLTAGKIVAIGPREQVAIPVGYDRLDLRGRYVVPGLINAHCHLFSDGKPKGVAASERLVKAYFALAGTWPTKELFKAQIRQSLRNALHAGVTTLRCVGDPFYVDVEMRKEIERGKVQGPRLLVAGLGIGITGGHAAVLSQQADSPWEFRKAVRNNVRAEVDLIKIFSTGGAADSRRVGEAGRPQMTVDEITAACDEAHRGGFAVASHVQSSRGIREALLGGVDTIEHGAALDGETIELFKHNPRSLRGESALIPTLSPVIHLSEVDVSRSKVSQATRDNVRLIRDGIIAGLRMALAADVRIGIGSDAAMPLVTHYDFWRELYYIGHFGEIEPRRVLSLATQSNAEILGIGDETGTLEVGKSADLMAVAEDPTLSLRALARPELVMMRGVLIREPRVDRFEQVDETVAEVEAAVR